MAAGRNETEEMTHLRRAGHPAAGGQSALQSQPRCPPLAYGDERWRAPVDRRKVRPAIDNRLFEPGHSHAGADRDVRGTVAEAGSPDDPKPGGLALPMCLVGDDGHRPVRMITIKHRPDVEGVEAGQRRIRPVPQRGLAVRVPGAGEFGQRIGRRQHSDDHAGRLRIVDDVRGELRQRFGPGEHATPAPRP